MAYLEFMRKNIKNFDIPIITILKHGVFSIGSYLCYKYVKQFKFSVFLFDKDTNKIGIKLMNEHLNHSYPIRFMRNNTHAEISAKAFLNNFNIKHKEKSYSYIAEWNDKENMIEIDLNKKV